MAACCDKRAVDVLGDPHLVFLSHRLNAAPCGRNWMALADALGYRPGGLLNWRESVDGFRFQKDPTRALLTDWSMYMTAWMGDLVRALETIGQEALTMHVKFPQGYAYPSGRSSKPGELRRVVPPVPRASPPAKLMEPDSSLAHFMSDVKFDAYRNKAAIRIFLTQPTIKAAVTAFGPYVAMSTLCLPGTATYEGTIEHPLFAYVILAALYDDNEAGNVFIKGKTAERLLEIAHARILEACSLDNLLGQAQANCLNYLQTEDAEGTLRGVLAGLVPSTHLDVAGLLKNPGEVFRWAALEHGNLLRVYTTIAAYFVKDGVTTTTVMPASIFPLSDAWKAIYTRWFTAKAMRSADTGALDAAMTNAKQVAGVANDYVWTAAEFSAMSNKVTPKMAVAIATHLNDQEYEREYVDETALVGLVELRGVRLMIVRKIAANLRTRV